MKTRIAVVGAGLLLTIGSAVAGSVMFGQDKSEQVASVASASQEVSAETIAMWKATSSTSGYIAPRVPL